MPKPKQKAYLTHKYNNKSAFCTSIILRYGGGGSHRRIAFKGENMTISEVIENVRQLKNGYDVTDEQIISDINRVEMNIIYNIISGRQGDNELATTYGNYNLETDRDRELLAPAPYDNIYQQYCISQIDMQYEDSERYENSSALYNNTFMELRAYWYRMHPQKKRYNFHI